MVSLELGNPHFPHGAGSGTVWSGGTKFRLRGTNWDVPNSFGSKGLSENRASRNVTIHQDQKMFPSSFSPSEHGLFSQWFSDWPEHSPRISHSKLGTPGVHPDPVDFAGRGHQRFGFTLQQGTRRGPAMICPWYTMDMVGITMIIEGSLEVKLPTIWTDEKQRWEESEKRREKKKGDQKRESFRRKKIQVREKVGKSRNTVFFQWFVAPEGRKVGSLKRRVRSHLARWEMKSCTPLWREAHFEVSDRFWKLRCRKSARCCGAKHISKSKSTKHLSIGALLEVEMFKKCTPLWREAHFEIKIYKTHQPQSTFGSWNVQKVYAIVARSTFRSENLENTSASEHFWKLRCSKSVRRCGAKHISKSKCTKHHMFAPLLDVEASFCVAGARDSPPCQKWAKREGFVAFPKTIALIKHLKRICKDGFRVAGAVQETCSWEMLGVRPLISWEGLHFGASDLQVCEDDFARQVRHFGMTWHHFFVVAGAVL